MDEVDEQDGIWALATMHMPGGIKPGLEYLVDPSSDYVREQITRGNLIPVAAAEETEETTSAGLSTGPTATAA